MSTFRALNPELAGHPFRRTLPAHVLNRLPVFEPEVLEAMRKAELRSQDMDWKKPHLQDVKDFLLAYCACLLAVLAFIV
jgi:hypothetical protein